MTAEKGRHPGAVWRKTDFQIHTPRDAGWSGSPSLPGGTEEFESAREKWADGFVQECLKRGLGAIAITDHHDLVMYPYVQRAIERNPEVKAKLWLFPGMEVTCDDSVQCLTLFDSATPPDVVQRLFGKMPKVPAPDANAKTAPQSNICGKEIRDFLGLMYEDTSFRGRNIVLPHGRQGGHKGILRKGFHSRFAELEVDGVYTERGYGDLEDSDRRKIYGEDKHWGDRRHGIITTGDNRFEDCRRLAINPCWVRLGEPTAEAIRQAVLADEARIAYDAPSTPSQRILELRIKSSLTGANFELTFNDGFNAIIGGRGSGKSAVLEYLRFALGRSTIDTDDASSERERELVTSTLAGGYVEVDLERDGVKETWRRTTAKLAFIGIRSESGETIELPINTVQERFRARAFSQKQLSTLVRHEESADEQITGIAAAESVDLRRQSEQRIETIEREIQAAFQRVVQQWAAEVRHKRAVALVADLKKRVDATRARLGEGGLSPEQQAILDRHPSYARAENQFQAATRSMAAKATEIGQLSQLGVEGWVGAIALGPVTAAQQAIAAANEKIAQAKAQLLAEIASAQTAVASSHAAFKELHEMFEQEYAIASAAQTDLAAILEDFKRLSAELEGAELQQQSSEDELRKLAGATETLTETRAALTSELASLRQILNDAANRVETMSNGNLRARVEEEASPQRFFDALMEISEKCNIRDLEQRCRSRVEEANSPAPNDWETLVQKLLEIRKAMIRAGESAELDPNLLNDIRSALGWELTDNQAKLVLGRLDDARVGRLLSVWASPFVRFDYRDRGTYMPFERASPGQQASALLMLLLNQEAGTLIIDQPEDDLDNRVIMTIVKLLQTTKRKRQLIFATHNPNFVVNGDADKVVCLTPNVEPSSPSATVAAQVEIETDGAIETPRVRDAITDTMEGGREAFELRGRKYAFEPGAAAQSQTSIA